MSVFCRCFIVNHRVRFFSDISRCQHRLFSLFLRHFLDFTDVGPEWFLAKSRCACCILTPNVDTCSILLDTEIKITRYYYNLTIMKSLKPATDNRFKWTLHCDKFWAWFFAVILKMATGRNFSMSGINSGHHYVPTYQILMISDNVECLRHFGGHFENGDR